MLSDDEIMAQVLAAFQAEQHEHRQSIANVLLELERNRQHPQRGPLLDQLFRDAHSLKGGARAARQFEVEQLAHAIEDLFSAVRRDALDLTPEVCDSVYATLDAIGVLMSQVTASQPVRLDQYQPVLAALGQLVQSAEQPGARLHSGDTATSPLTQAIVIDGPVMSRELIEAAVPLHRSPADSEGADSSGAVPDGRSAGDTTVRIATANLDALLHETGELITCTVRQQQRTREAQRLLDLFNPWRRTWRVLRPVYTRLRSHATETRPTVHYLADDRATTAGSTAATDHDTAVLLNALAQAHDLISELERQLSLHARDMAEDSSRLDTISDRLHTQVRQTRMLPLATLWGPVRLQIREMARAAGKTVELDLDDGGAEADRQVLDHLREVLLHLLRNAIDHGLEEPAQRLAAGKPAVGLLKIRVDVSGDRLVIVLSDDGAGLDLHAIQERAIASGLLASADVAHIDPAELADLIFMPGFSTRTVVSSLSGRGVGLDIVRAQLERMHGRVSVQSTPGRGCAFTLSVPLSLTSTQGLLVESGGRLYVVSIDGVQRILAIDPASIHILEGRAVLELDSRPVPLAHLRDLLGSATPASTSTERSCCGVVLLLRVGEREVACIVDAVVGEQEVVVQRLPAPLQQVRYLVGATILADGRVAPILDVVDLVRGVLGARTSLAVAAEPLVAPRKLQVLVVDDSITTRTLEKNILVSAGYDVHLAADGAEAFALLTQLFDAGGCDLLLSDVDMPRLNGFELTARVRQEPRLQHLPVVLMTSLDTPADRERGVAAGADAYLVKRGFDQRGLLDVIAGLL